MSLAADMVLVSGPHPQLRELPISQDLIIAALGNLAIQIHYENALMTTSGQNPAALFGYQIDTNVRQ